MKKLKAGFARVDITPPLGVSMAGYFSRREAEGILDPLYASALSVSDGNKKGVIVSCDLIGLGGEYVDTVRERISDRLDMNRKMIMIHSTHTHTGPHVKKRERERKGLSLGEPDEEYMRVLVRKIADAVQMSWDNRREASLEAGYGAEDSISFIRRFRMEDGSVMTNPGVGNPDVIEPVGRIDPTVGVIRFDFDDGEGDILLVNFALHPDIIGGNSFSADYPGHMRGVLAGQLPESDVLYINGAAGDINHIDVFNPGRTAKGYTWSRRVGTILACEVLKVYQHLRQNPEIKMDSAGIEACTERVSVPLRQVSEKEVESAQELLSRFHSGEWEILFLKVFKLFRPHAPEDSF